MVIKQNKGYKLPLSKIQIIELYKSGNSCYKIANMCNCTPQSIWSILKKAEITLRSLSSAALKYKHNTSYFKEIDTQEKAYLLGLLYADGNIFNNTLSITLQEQDKPIIERFKKALKYTGPVLPIKKSGNRKQQWKLSVTSPDLVKDLLDHGMFPNKGFFLKFPISMPYKLASHFIRGYFDGDGCIYTNPKNHDYLFSVVSTKEVLKYFRDIFIHELGLSRTQLYNPPKAKNKNLYILTYQGKNNVRLIRGFLYKRANIFLQRKKDKFFSV